METHRILLTAGSNAKGQLGIGSYDDAHIFTPCQFVNYEPNQLPDLTSRVLHIACGANHTILLLEHLDGSITLWGTGDGRRGQLGPEFRDGVAVFHNLPMPLSASYASRGYMYKLIAAAWETTYVVLSYPGESDVLISMGSNDFGALGVGEEVTGSSASLGIPRVVNFDHLFTDDLDDRAEPPRISIRSLHTGPRHVIAQLTIATSRDTSSQPKAILVGWGASRHGQLGEHGGARFISQPIPLPINIQDDPMVSCALGNQHTVVLHRSGRISALGSNKQGQIPSTKCQGSIRGVGCTWNGTYVQLVEDDKPLVLSMGNNAQGQLGRRHTGSAPKTAEAVTLPVEHAISALICGSEHVLVRTSGASEGDTSSLMGWGWNEHGNMGLGSSGNVDIPTQLWPRDDIEAYTQYPQRVLGTWAGCATSWLLVE